MAERLQVVVYGATGFTGRLICEQLERRKVRYAVAGRDRAKLEALSMSLASRPSALTANVSDPASLRAMAERARVVLSCAGPFLKYGPPVLEAAIASKAHWLDITGEYGFMDQVFAHDQAAKAAGVALVTAVGMDVIPTDLAASLASEGLPDVEWLRIALATRSQMTRGTMKSGLELLHEGGLAYRDGARVREPIGQDLWNAPFPEPLGRRVCLSAPLADLVTAPRTTGCRNMRVYAKVPKTATQGLIALRPALSLVSSAPGRAIAARFIDRLPEGPSAETRRTGGFTVVAQAESKDGRSARAWLKGPEPYTFTGYSASWCALTASSDAFTKTGALTPVQAFGTRELLDALAPDGVTSGREG